MNISKSQCLFTGFSLACATAFVHFSLGWLGLAATAFFYPRLARRFIDSRYQRFAFAIALLIGSQMGGAAICLASRKPAPANHIADCGGYLAALAVVTLMFLCLGCMRFQKRTKMRAGQTLA